MAQKFSSLEEAANQLGVSKDRLSQLREAGKVRGYRDGASWKFRSEDIERLSAEGIPTIDPPPSDIDLGSGLSLDLERADSKGKWATSSGIDLDLPAAQSAAGEPSDVNLDEIDEPTLPAATPDEESEGVLALGDDEELLDLSDSILLSEKDLGGAGARPPSTIIGKAELDPDGDLDLTLRGESGSTAMSDVKLAGATSDVLVGGDDESLDLEPPSLSDNFQGLAEVDVDLEAESSRILSPGDAAKGKGAAKAKAAPPPSSELQLAASDSDTGQATSDIGLGGSQASGSAITGLSALELENDSDSDNEVLGEGSDITLSSESSGINIISPSDSGLALDEVALSSASMSSPLDLGAEEMTLEPLELSEDAGEGEEPFQLTPLGEAEDEEKDSSQIIALDDISEEETTGVVFQAEEGEAAVGSDDFGAPAGLAPGMVPVAVASTADDVAMSGAVFGLLTCGVVLLLVCGMMMYDLVRNIWSWDSVAPLNSTLIEVVNPLL